MGKKKIISVCLIFIVCAAAIFSYDKVDTLKMRLEAVVGSNLYLLNNAYGSIRYDEDEPSEEFIKETRDKLYLIDVYSRTVDYGTGGNVLQAVSSEFTNTIDILESNLYLFNDVCPEIIRMIEELSGIVYDVYYDGSDHYGGKPDLNIKSFERIDNFYTRLSEYNKIISEKAERKVHNAVIENNSEIAEMISYDYEKGYSSLYIAGLKIFEEFGTKEFGYSNEGTVSISDGNILKFNMTTSTGPFPASGSVTGPEVRFEMNLNTNEITAREFLPAPNYTEGARLYPEHINKDSIQYSERIIELSDERLTEIGMYFKEYIINVSLELSTSCDKNNELKEENAIEINFNELPYLMEDLPEVKNTPDWIIAEEYHFDDFNQILYKNPEISDSETDLFSAILINDKIYDMGKVTYYYANWNDPNKVAESYKEYKINNVAINSDMHLYKINFQYGANTGASKYFKFINNIPCVLAEIYRSSEYDIDEDGSMETISVIGTAPQITIYEWTEDKLYYFDFNKDFNNSYGLYREDSNTIELWQDGNDYITMLKYRNGKLYETGTKKMGE